MLLDEIGRGTSTYDGVSIAWAVTEHLHERVGARTIFATHYHELTQLGDLLPGVRNLNVSVREVGEQIVFLRRLEEGGADRSYGIQVARLAGLPEAVIERAHAVLRDLEAAEGSHAAADAKRPKDDAQLALALGSAASRLEIRQRQVLDELSKIDPEATTPLEALTALERWREHLEDE